MKFISETQKFRERLIVIMKRMIYIFQPLSSQQPTYICLELMLWLHGRKLGVTTLQEYIFLV